MNKYIASITYQPSEKQREITLYYSGVNHADIIADIFTGLCKNVEDTARGFSDPVKRGYLSPSEAAAYEFNTLSFPCTLIGIMALVLPPYIPVLTCVTHRAAGGYILNRTVMSYSREQRVALEQELKTHTLWGILNYLSEEVNTNRKSK